MRKQLLTKMLLIAATLFMGTSAWAEVEVTETYDFASFITANGVGNLTTSGDEIAQSGTSAKVGNVKVINNLTANAKTLELNGRFAVDYQYNAGSQIRFMWRSSTNTYQHGLAGQWNSKGTADSQGAARFSVLNMKAGDKIKLTYYKQGGKAADPYTCSASQLTGVAVDAALSSGTEYTVAADGNVDLYFTNNNFAIASIVIKTKGTETVTNPGIAVTAASGVTRSVTITAGISSASNSVTTYYTIDGTDPTTSSPSFSSDSKVITIGEGAIEESIVTVKALSISSASAESGISSLNVTVGTQLKLVAPTFDKTNYSSNNYTITINSDQSSVAGLPSPSYYYRIGAEGDFTAYTSAVSVPEGETIYAYAASSGYANSDNSSLTTTVMPVFAEVWTTDFTKLKEAEVNYTETTFGSTYYELTNVNSNFGAAPVENSNRYYIHNGGLYVFYGGNRKFAINNLETGDYIRITSSMATSASSGVELQSDLSYGNVSIYKATADGIGIFSTPRYNVIYKVEVLKEVTSVSARIASTTGYATFSSIYAVNVDVEGLTAYKAVSSNGVYVTMEKVTGDVAANTGLVISGTNGVTYQLPVVASGTTITGNMLQPCDGSWTTLSASETGTNYVLSVQGGNAVFAPIGETPATLRAGVAYLYVPNSSDSRTLNIVFGDEATGISNVKSATTADGQAFNLAGQRVAQPTKGLYIVNGKKVIIK